MDRMIRAITADAAIQIAAVQTTEMVEKARNIHKTLPLATAALGRTLTITSLMGNQLKVENGSVTVQVRGNGPLGRLCVLRTVRAMRAAICRIRHWICPCVPMES